MRFEKTLQISINNLQSFGRLYFTPKQLFYEFCRQTNSPPGIEPNTAAGLFGLSTIPAILKRKNKLGFLGASALVLATLAAFRALPYTLSLPLTREKFEDLLMDYLENHQIEGLLEITGKVEFVQQFPTDLMLYGLPKMLICESDEIAQMLRANQFHLQTPCAVWSLNEVSLLSEGVKKMLKRAQEPQVYFLHDASLKAFSNLQNLRQTLALDAEIPLRPLGLRPAHARRLHLFAAKTPAENFALAGFDYLTESEKNWLRRGNLAEVSSISPVRLLRVLRRLILGLEIQSSDWQISLPKKNLGFM